MRDVLNLTFSSSLTEMCEINSSFDTGILRVCYTGKNRNGSFISKEALERGLKTIANCPIVCNYDRDEDEFGGHDMELVHESDGGLRLVNLTQPIGVIPESAKQWFSNYTDENGVEHEYLYTEVLLWKRQEAYRKIKEDGITSESMEITVNAGKRVDGIYHIEDFEFTAFALIGVEPCYESSALEVFSMSDFKQQMSEMMRELKETFTLVNTPSGDDNTHPKNSMEGGETALDKKMELVAKYGIDVDALDFSIEDFTVEELIEKFEAITKEFKCGDDDKKKCAEEEDEDKKSKEECGKCGDDEKKKCGKCGDDDEKKKCGKCGDDDEKKKCSKCGDDDEDEKKSKCFDDGDPDDDPDDDTTDDPNEDPEEEQEPEPEEEDDEPEEEVLTDDGDKKRSNGFALNSAIVDGIFTALSHERIEHEWGECPRYCFADYDADVSEVYCWDSCDWLLYGFKFSMDGDNVVIDFESKMRKKYVIADFDEGEQASPFAKEFSIIGESFAALKTELNDLRAFKASVDKAEADAKFAELFAQFEDLAGNEAFEKLKAECEQYELEALEEKCFAIRGREKSTAKFSLETKSPKFMVGFDKAVVSNEPYGDLFVKYQIGQ